MLNSFHGNIIAISNFPRRKTEMVEFPCTRESNHQFRNLWYRGNFKSLQKCLKILAVIRKWSVFGGYSLSSHAQTTISISSAISFQQNFAGLLKLPLYIINYSSVPDKGCYLRRGKSPFEGRSFFPSSTCYGVAWKAKTELRPFFSPLFAAFRFLHHKNQNAIIKVKVE